MIFTEDCTQENSLLSAEISQCQQMEDRDACWHSLAQNLMQELTATQHRLQQVIAQHQYLEAEHKQLAEKLEESEAKNGALREASVAQAQQFGQTLKELRQNQAQIIQSEKMASLGQLVAGVAHEINNPVNFIYGNLPHVAAYVQNLMHLLQLYQQYYPHPVPEIEAAATTIDLEFLTEDLPKLLLSMRGGAERIQKIVLSLRNFSRLDEAEMKQVDIHEGIESTLLILQNRLKAKSNHPEIRLVKAYGKLPPVECYVGQLNQVVMNILVNAIDAVDERDAGRSITEQIQQPSTIEITTEVLPNNQIAIRVMDNGLGIPEQIQPHIFNPFFTTKPVGKGTGMGMSISYQIVTIKHQGRLYCQSRPGQGAEFVIEIPIQQQPCQAKQR